jgi:hypothetical protein
MAADRFQISCAHCGRSLNLSIAALQKNRGCTYCGKSLALTSEIENALKSAGAETNVVDVRSTQAISIDCPICARVSRIKALAGTSSKCMFCGCPFLVPIRDGIGPPLPPLEGVPRFALGESLAAHTPFARCPTCKAPKLLASDALALQVQCAGCNESLDANSRTLDTFADLSPGIERAPLVLLAREALRARWLRREVGMPEAIRLFEWFDAIDSWLEFENEAFSPFGPEFTAEIVQWAVLNEPNARLNRDVESMLLEVEIKDDLQIDLNVRSVLKGTADELKETGKQIRRMMTQGVQSQDKIVARFHFAPVDGGSDLELSIRHSAPIDSAREPDEVKKRAKLDQELQAGLRLVIAQMFANSAHQYLALKAIFGIWITPSIYNASTEKGAQRRLEALGGECAKNAAQFARQLTERSRPAG